MYTQRVTSDGCVNMTNCPSEVRDIKPAMAGAPWPIKKKSNHPQNGECLFNAMFH
ncbi:hypothetical protein LguiB_018062 [Lonicera macranthoides]